MPICQPAHTTINTTDFQDGSYSFPVESVLGPEATPGRLVVSVSAGYILTTSLTNQPRREHTFNHNKQADNSWIASGMVTVSISDKTLVNGMIVIRNSLAESLILTIVATSTALERSPVPALMVSQPALTFAPTTPGKPSFLVLTIAQPYTDAPLILTTDAPDYFQLASDSHPQFGAALILNPSPVGTHVHVRYLADRQGSHTSQLVIHNAFEHCTVALTGRSNALLPIVLHTFNRPVRKRLWVTALGLIIVGSLGIASYSNHYSFFPAFFPNKGIKQAASQTNSSPAVSAKVDVVSTVGKTAKPKRLQKKPMTTAESSVARLMPEHPATTESISTSADEQQPITGSPNLMPEPGLSETPTDQSLVNTVSERPHQQVLPAPPARESELERELNRVPPK